MSADAISIRTTMWNAGCLPGLLRREIVSVERWLGIVEPQEPARKDVDDYLGQLRGILHDVEAARRGWMVR